MKYFVTTTEGGRATAFYCEDIWGAFDAPDSQIPRTAFEISEAVWKDWMQNSDMRRWVNGELQVHDPLPSQGELIAYANNVQMRKALGGVAVTIGDTTIPFATDPVSMAFVNGKVLRLQLPNPPAFVNWQTGPTELTQIATADFMAGASEVADFIQSTFDILPSVFGRIEDGSITSTDEIDAAFNLVNPG